MFEFPDLDYNCGIIDGIRLLASESVAENGPNTVLVCLSTKFT